MAHDVSDNVPAPSRRFPRLTAIVRGVSPAIARCELTHFDRMPIDLDLARRQHSTYVAALVSLGVGVGVVALGVEPDLPDSVFVEDTAIVVDEVAIITRPGAASRLAETNAVAAALGTFPKTLDRLISRGFKPARLVDLSELAKAEAALTCCSLLFKAYQ